MPRDIIVTLDVMLARRKMKAKDLAAAIGITEANLSLLKSGKVKGVRFETLAKLCEVLDCKPGDLLDFGAVAASSAPARQEEDGNLA
jgi:putative transcriptional regulator